MKTAFLDTEEKGKNSYNFDEWKLQWNGMFFVVLFLRRIRKWL
jgi:hypothetical protein